MLHADYVVPILETLKSLRRSEIVVEGHPISNEDWMTFTQYIYGEWYDEVSPEALKAICCAVSQKVSGDPFLKMKKDLPKRECEILEYFLQRVFGIVTIGELYRHIYGSHSNVSPSTLYSHISKLNKKLAHLGYKITGKRYSGYVMEKINDAKL